MIKLVKNGISLVLAISMAITILPGVRALAAEEESYKFTVNTVEGAPIIYEKINAKTVEVDGIEPGYEGEATIPEQVQDSNGKSYIVIGIGEEALSVHDKLVRTTVTEIKDVIPDVFLPGLLTVRKIVLKDEESDSFVTSVKIPSTVQYIEDKAFAYNFMLNNIEIQTQYPPALGEGIFDGCIGIEYIEFPQTWPENSFVIKHTSKDVIYDVTDFSITGSVLDNNDRPVEGAKVSVCSQDGTEITSTYTNSEGLYTIINTELDGEYQLKVEKAGFTSVSQDAVLNSDNIMGALYDFHLNAAKFTVNTVEGAAITYQSTSPNTVKVVSGPGAGYSGALTIPNKVNCDGVEYTVTGIGAYVFIYYEKLTIVTLPDTLKTIDDGAFSCCRFDKMIINCQTPPELGNGVFDYSMFKFDVPSGAEDAYKAAGWQI